MLFRRRAAGLLLLASALSAPAIRACDMCYDRTRVGPSPLVDGARAGILFMLALVAVMLAGFAGLFVFWGRRARRLAAGEIPDGTGDSPAPETGTPPTPAS